MLRFALVGCGFLGGVHAGCVARIDDAEFVAYADTNEAAAQKALSTFGGKYATTDLEQIYADDDIDAVYICTRHDSHASIAIAAAKAGKHVLVEKPLAMTSEDCEAIDAAVRASGIFLMPAFKMRYYPLVRKAHEFIPEPQVVVGQVMDDRWGDDMWAQDPVQGGANVLGQGVHATDLIRFLAGSEPSRLWASGGSLTHPGHPCIDQCVASIQFANGNIGSWIQGDAAVPQLVSKFYFELFGGGRSVQLDSRLTRATFYDGTKTWTEERSEEEGFYLENVEFVSALLEGRPPELTAYDGLQATRIVLAAEASIRTGEVQTLSAT